MRMSPTPGGNSKHQTQWCSWSMQWNNINDFCLGLPCTYMYIHLYVYMYICIWVCAHVWPAVFRKLLVTNTSIGLQFSGSCRPAVVGLPLYVYLRRRHGSLIVTYSGVYVWCNTWANIPSPPAALLRQRPRGSFSPVLHTSGGQGSLQQYRGRSQQPFHPCLLFEEEPTQHSANTSRNISSGMQVYKGEPLIYSPVYTSTLNRFQIVLGQLCKCP